MDTDRTSRAEAACALRLSGATYYQIARTLEYANSTSARSAVENALGASVTDAEKKVLREVAGRRLERLLLSVWDKATNPSAEEHLSAVRTALSIADRHMRLYGLDAPAEVNLAYTPAGAELAEWVATMAAQVRGELPAEADIIDAEVVGEQLA